MSQSKLPVSRSRSAPISLEVSGSGGVAKNKEKKKGRAKSGDSSSLATRNKLFTKRKAPPKKSEKGDGASSSSHNNSSSSNNNNNNNNNSSSSTRPHDRKDRSTTPTPSPQEEEQRQHTQDQQPSQQHREQQHDPAHRQTTSSPQPPYLHAPLSHHQQQHLQQHQQQQPPRQSTPRPRYFDDVSSSDQNSDLDSWYGSLPRQGKSVRICESDGEGDPHGPRGPGGRRAGPRRHTVGGAQIREHMQLVQDTDRKREAFYEMLASRYPQYADKIHGLAAYPNQPTCAAERASRPREPQRRRTTVVTHGAYSSRPLDYDDPGTMSDVELSSFQRSGYARASLPIVRSASTSLERPIGLVFLVYRDETKKALLPNEITSLDTVRALFVRAFPEKLSMEFLDSPKRKIYILEASTSIFFQLEDLRDIQDRTVLKIHECDSVEPQYVKSQIEIRGRATQPARPSSRQGFIGESGPHFRDEMAKTQSLPAQNYQDLLQKERVQWELEQEYIQAQLRRSRSRSVTPEPADRPRSLSTGPPRGRYSHSPDRLPTPDRGPPQLNPIPENPRLLANGFRQAAVNGSQYDSSGHLHGLPPTGHQHPPPPPGRVLSPPPVGQPVYETAYQAGSYPHPQAYVTHSTRAPLPQGPQRATGPPPPDMRGNNRGGPPQRPSLNFGAMSNPVYESFPQRAQQYRTTPERDALPPRPHSATSHEASRMERMEAQIASLAAWVHQVQTSPMDAPPQRRNSSRSTSSAEGTDTYPGSSASSLSDIPAAYPARQPVVTSDMRDKINDMQCRMRELRVELQGLRRMEQLNQESMRDAFTDTFSKIKKVISAVPGAENQVIRQQRVEVSSLAEAYRQDKARVEKELSDLETSVEELKEDVIARKCRVNISDVEGLALVLSNITKSLADLKARFPQVNESLRRVMTGEMEIVVKDERFIKEEPLHIEASLKRCKKLTSTLYTLKRLATVQDTRPPHVPSLAMECKEVGDEEKMAILESIRAMVPDHETRVQSLEAAESSRERKKKIVTQQESMKFTKSLQTASKSLKPPETQSTTTRPAGDGDKDSKKPVSGAEMSDGKRPDPPIIPAKPARLMLTSESKPAESCSVVSVVSSRPVAHTVTVTSQMCSEVEKEEKDSKPCHRGSARSAFFGSLESSPHSSQSDRTKSSSKTSPTVTVSSGLPVSSSSFHSKPAASSSKTRGSPSISGRSVSLDESSTTEKGRKVPPPPPPRRSSAKFPYGIGPLSPQSPSENGGSGGPALHRQNSGDKGKKVLTVYKAQSPTSSGPLSSTPKPATPQKPQGLNKLQKEGATGQKVGVKRGDIQHQKVVPDRLLSTFVSPVPAAVTTNSQDPIDEGDLSGSESTGSTTSLDSQQGAPLLRSNSSPSHRPPKPNPPQRQSSLSGKDPQDCGMKTKTQMLQDRAKKSQQAGTSITQVNGLDGAKAGHKT